MAGSWDEDRHYRRPPTAGAMAVAGRQERPENARRLTRIK
jgi:hypothetical protein